MAGKIHRKPNGGFNFKQNHSLFLLSDAVAATFERLWPLSSPKQSKAGKKITETQMVVLNFKQNHSLFFLCDAVAASVKHRHLLGDFLDGLLRGDTAQPFVAGTDGAAETTFTFLINHFQHTCAERHHA